MAKFDITGQGTILDMERRNSRSHSFSKDTPPEVNTAPAPSEEPAHPHRKRAPNHKQQLKHALTVNAAHVITIDYLTLSQPLSEGILLMDRTEKKLKLIHSLGELQPLHRYTTEYGNVLERVSKHRAVLAGSIELEIDTDQAHFDDVLGAASLDPNSSAARRSLHAPERMAAYQAFTSKKSSSAMPIPNADEDAASVMEETGRLQEAEAMRRIAALVSRMAEMEDWFKSVKAEAASERSMREMANVRLQVTQERLERMQEQLTALQKENKSLRERLVDVQLADKVQPGTSARAGTLAFNSF